MVIIRIKGGLGNQLFQYALGRRLAFDRGTELKLDISWFSTQTKREFELNKFKLHFDIASDDEIYRTRYYSHNRFVRKIFSIYQRRLPYWKKRIIKEKDIGIFDPKILTAPKDVLLEGYWQSEEYFKSISEIIKEDLLSGLDQSGSILGDEIKQDPFSVSVHIRRGDYVYENTGHWVCTADYYLNAVKIVGHKVTTPHFYFFSDDMEWVKRNLKIDYPVTYVESGGNTMRDLAGMSLCYHHINANSSFSWWGAWLGEREGSTVITPSQWFNVKPYPVDTIPERWIKL